MDELTVKVKNELVKNLRMSEDLLDRDYLHVGIKSYTRRELANEIENETDFGIEWLGLSLSVSLDIIARNSKKQ